MLDKLFSIPVFKFRSILIVGSLFSVSACSHLTYETRFAAAAPPKIVAHRAGTADAPENTIYAIQVALAHGADMLWMSVQVTKDNIPVLYRPPDLSVLTNGRGKVGETNFSELKKLNAGYHFKRSLAEGREASFPFRSDPVGLPTLREALQKIPANIPILLDMKESSPNIPAIARVLEDLKAWNRVRFYSTQSAHIQMWKTYSQARFFEERDITRQRLVDLMLGNPCTPPAAGSWVGMELERAVEVTENFTLGKGVSKAVAHWWTPRAIKCHRKKGRVYIVVFGIDQEGAYRQARRLGVDAVMTDSPALFAHRKCKRPSDSWYAYCRLKVPSKTFNHF